jgi:hypothetical protein
MTKLGKGQVVLCVLFGIGQLGFAQSASRAASQTAWAAPASDVSPKVILRVYDYAVSRALLLRSESEATTILKHAGLEVEWVDCPLTVSEWEAYPRCQVPPSPADFALKILNAKGAERFSAQQEALGQALECPRNQVGCSAYIFYRGVLELARDGEAAEYQLLGHALAHEIGHLLLGPNSHSPNGIMSAHWRHRDIQTMARAELLFSEQQSDRIREEMEERTTVQQVQLGKAQMQ